MAAAQFEDMMNYPIKTSEHLVDSETGKHLIVKVIKNHPTRTVQFASAGRCMWFPAAAAPVLQVSAGLLCFDGSC